MERPGWSGRPGFVREIQRLGPEETFASDGGFFTRDCLVGRVRVGARRLADITVLRRGGDVRDGVEFR